MALWTQKAKGRPWPLGDVAMVWAAPGSLMQSACSSASESFWQHWVGEQGATCKSRPHRFSGFLSLDTVALGQLAWRPGLALSPELLPRVTAHCDGPGVGVGGLSGNRSPGCQQMERDPSSCRVHRKAPSSRMLGRNADSRTWAVDTPGLELQFSFPPSPSGRKRGRARLAFGGGHLSRGLCLPVVQVPVGAALPGSGPLSPPHRGPVPTAASPLGPAAPGTPGTP